MNYDGIKDYLSNTVEQTELDNLQNQPALLFENREGKFGNIYLFKKFGSETTNSISLRSQITTHYMENNVSAQDHWAIAPIGYTLSGLVGEVMHTTKIKNQEVKQRDLIDYLKPLGMISPTFDSLTQSAINEKNAIIASLQRYEKIARKVFAEITNIQTKTTNQQKIIEMLNKLRVNRQLVTVYTPFGVYENLAIEEVTETQNNSKYQSNLEIRFLQWRNIETFTRKANKEDLALIAQMQKAQETEQGTAAQKPSDLKLIYKYKKIDFWGNPTE